MRGARTRLALMLALCPDLVEAGRMVQNVTWYTESAPVATAAQGQVGVVVILRHLRRVLGLPDPLP